MTDKPRKQIPSELISKVAHYFTNNIVYNLMKAMSKDDILHREYRSILVFKLTQGFCEYNNFAHDSEEASMAMSLFYSNIFNPIHLLFTEPIIQKFFDNPCVTDTQIDTQNQLIAEGLETDNIEVPENVHDLREFSDKKVH